MAGHAKTLNPRRQVFAETVAAGKPLIEAYRIAGYTINSVAASSNASQLARIPIVAAEIKRQQARARATTEFNAERWRNELAARYQQAADGSRVGDQANALRALELWGRHLGLLEPHAPDDERLRRLTDNLALLAGVQLGQKLALAPTRTVEGEVRETLALPASQPEEPAPPAS